MRSDSRSSDDKPRTTCCPSVSRKAAPRTIPNMPSVAINGGTLTRATSKPLIKPGIKATSSPAKTPASIAYATSLPLSARSRITRAVVTDDKPTVQPMDRSMPAVITT